MDTGVPGNPGFPGAKMIESGKTYGGTAVRNKSLA
jgi:hypothetical protein